MNKKLIIKMSFQRWSFLSGENVRIKLIQMNNGVAYTQPTNEQIAFLVDRYGKEDILKNAEVWIYE